MVAAGRRSDRIVPLAVGAVGVRRTGIDWFDLTDQGWRPSVYLRSHGGLALVEGTLLDATGEPDTAESMRPAERYEPSARACTGITSWSLRSTASVAPSTP